MGAIPGYHPGGIRDGERFAGEVNPEAGAVDPGHVPISDLDAVGEPTGFGKGGPGFPDLETSGPPVQKKSGSGRVILDPLHGGVVPDGGKGPIPDQDGGGGKVETLCGIPVEGIGFSDALCGVAGVKSHPGLSRAEIGGVRLKDELDPTAAKDGVVSSE